MTVWMVVGVAALVAALLFLVVWLAQKRGEAVAKIDIQGGVSETQTAMAAADAAKPSSGDELVERLRNAGL